jgi:hypothetical protein
VTPRKTITSLASERREFMSLPGSVSYRTLEAMQGNFRKTIKADGNDGCSDTDRGIAHHIAIFPWSRAHMPWQNRIKSDRD